MRSDAARGLPRADDPRRPLAIESMDAARAAAAGGTSRGPIIANRAEMALGEVTAASSSVRDGQRFLPDVPPKDVEDDH